MSESNLTRNIIKGLRREFMKAWIYKTADKFTHGIPDLLILNERRFYALEIKLPGNKATPLQAYTIKEINKAGGFAAVVTSVKEALEVLRHQR